MSVLNELETLKATRKKLEENLARTSSSLTALYAKRAPILQKIEYLSTRTSSLAQTLLKEAQEELSKVNQEIAPVEKNMKKQKKELAENQQNISLREDDPTLYINEQSSIMISTFLKYMGDHLKDFGTAGKKTFRIESYETRIRDGLFLPTGYVGIYDEGNHSFIVLSKDFYFAKSLYRYSNKRYSVTEWYKTFFKQFVSQLLKTLKENYTYDEFFKLTIENSSFTLELV